MTAAIATIIVAGMTFMAAAATRRAASAQDQASAPQGQAPALAQAVGQINGTLYNAGRKGVAGLSVVVVAQPGPHIYGTTSDQAGRYLLKGLEAGTYGVAVAAPAGVARKDAIRVRPLFRSIVDFTVPADLQAAAPPAPEPAASAPDPGSQEIAIACLVTDREREPIADATILLTPVEGAGRPRRGRTGADGRCRLEEVPPGAYRIAARAPGFMSWSHGPFDVRKPGELRLSLTLVTFPMGFEGTLDDLLIPVDPIPPPSAERTP